MRKVIVLLTAAIILLYTTGIGLAVEGEPEADNISQIYKAKVIKIKDTIKEEFQEGNITVITQIADVKILDKDLKGKVVEVQNSLSGNPAYDVELEEGITVSITREEGEGGQATFFVAGYERVSYIFQITGIFLVLLVLIGGWKGIKSIVSLGITVFLILYIMIPQLLKGMNPILISIIVCALSTVITMVIIAGWNKKSISAMLGTIGGITVGGSVAYIYGMLSRLTGLGSQEAQMLMYIPQEIQLDFRGLLFAGILIGALGAAMDVSISIASALTELSEKDNSMSFGQIVRHGMNIGKDIMGTMSNTLILAYTGGALAMIMLFAAYQRPVNEIINLDFVATEIIRSVAGSIGLLFAIPITAIIFAFLQRKICKNG
ncbi:MAG: hypothetical protein PWP27_2253 [Clostridiales bacterium]|nr:hypothetical protein [Clostridiales bacterium]MDK2934443.1 hypothetical protein [Clostridiales bacterium]